jgi:hypothetical protein
MRDLRVVSKGLPSIGVTDSEAHERSRARYERAAESVSANLGRVLVRPLQTFLPNEQLHEPVEPEMALDAHVDHAALTADLTCLESVFIKSDQFRCHLFLALGNIGFRLIDHRARDGQKRVDCTGKQLSLDVRVTRRDRADV